jgi:hypothetical protein
VVASSREITPAERRFIEVIAELHGTRVDVDALTSVAPEDVAQVVTAPHQRKRVVQLAMIAAMVEGDVTAAETTAVRALASALGVDERGLKALQEVAGRHRFLTRFDMTRRILGKFGAEAYEEEGLAGVRKIRHAANARLRPDPSDCDSGSVSMRSPKTVEPRGGM